MNESLPSIQTVRERIESIQEIDPRYPRARRVPKNACLYQLEMAHKYQFLVAGRVSEVAGKYRPEENTAFDININGEPGVLFAVKTAKKKTEQGFTYRGPAVPFRYEPWAKEVRDYLSDHPEPFAFQKLPATSKRTMEAASSYIFDGLNYIYRRYLWIGISIDRNKLFDPVDKLRDLETEHDNIKFISFEPLLEKVEPNLEGIDWIIIGGKTGPQSFTPPKEWVESLTENARENGCAVFHKNNLPYAWIQEFPHRYSQRMDEK